LLVRAGMVRDAESDAVRERVTRIIDACGDRLKVAGDVLLQADFFFRGDDEFTYDEKDFAKRVQAPGAVERLLKFREWLVEVPDWDVAPLEKALHEFVEEEGLGIGDIIHVLRVAVTGRSVGPGLYDCLAILGRDSVLAR